MPRFLRFLKLISPQFESWTQFGLLLLLACIATVVVIGASSLVLVVFSWLAGIPFDAKNLDAGISGLLLLTLGIFAVQWLWEQWRESGEDTQGEIHE